MGAAVSNQIIERDINKAVHEWSIPIYELLFNL